METLVGVKFLGCVALPLTEGKHHSEEEHILGAQVFTGGAKERSHLKLRDRILQVIAAG